MMFKRGVSPIAPLPPLAALLLLAPAAGGAAPAQSSEDMERAFFKSRAPVGGRDMEFLEDMCKALTAKGTNVYDADFGDVGQLAAGHGISELRHKHVMVKVRIVLMIGESGEEVVKRAKSGGAGRILPSSSERRLIAGTLRKIAPKEAEQRPGLWRAGGGRPERPASQSRGLR